MAWACIRLLNALSPTFCVNAQLFIIINVIIIIQLSPFNLNSMNVYIQSDKNDQKLGILRKFCIQTLSSASLFKIRVIFFITAVLVKWALSV